MINIIKHKNIPFAISTLLFMASVVILLIFGLRLGIDFTGGSLLEVSFTEERPSVQEVKSSLQAMELDLGDVVVQPSEEKNMLIRMRFVNEEEHQQVLGKLRENFETKPAVEFLEKVEEDSVKNEEDSAVNFSENEIRQEESNPSIGVENKVFEERIETIGPAISSQLKSRAIYAIIAVVIAIIIYIAYAFRKVSKPVQSWKYGLTAIIALLHDIMIVLGIFALLGRFLNVEIGIPFVVALLTILGYSVNDSIVVFDRVRENLIKRSSEHFSEMVNMGLNQTFVRSLNTSLTTLIVLFALFLFGGESIKYFALALIIGIISGTYSSIFLASPLLVVWEQFKNRRL